MSAGEGRRYGMGKFDPSKMRSRGDVGEDVIAAYLEEHKCTIIARNFTARGGEIDLIAENEVRILFVEVKSRVIDTDTLRYGRPAAAVTYDKQRRIISTAREYLRRHPSEKAVRFDVAEVFLSKDTPPVVRNINYMKNAFILQKGRNDYE